MLKRGIFFSIDALLAFTIILVIVLIAFPLTKTNKYETPISRDILLTLSSIKVGEIPDSFVQSLVASGALDANKTALEQIGILSITNETLAKSLTGILLQSINIKENIGIWYGNKLIYSSNQTAYENASDIYTERYIVSGFVVNSTGAFSGYSARGFLSSTFRTKYFYFGGYIGDGNLTSTVDYYGNITSAELEIAINKNFTLYINNLSAGNYQESQSEFTPRKYDLTSHLSKFSSGSNIIDFKGDNLYIAGGYIKITYDSNASYQQTTKQYLPGVTGIINIYDGLRVPSDLTGLNITLDLDSDYITFLNIGNITVFNRTTNGREVINLNNTYLLSKLGNYNWLSNKTTPIRLGLENLSFNITTKVDVISVADLSGSMDYPLDCQLNPSTTPCKINDAKNATKILIDTILGVNNSRVGLAGFERWARKSDSHNLSNSSNSLKKIVNETWDADGMTCICCGIIKAIRCFDNQTFFDNFNGQAAGSNPIGWVRSEPSGSSINIVSQSLEGDRAVKIERRSSNNPSMSHAFAPEENNISIDFMINHSTGNGRARIEIESINQYGTSYNDYIVLKMYSGQIRNLDTSVTPYSLNSVYNISVQTVPSTARFNLFVNGALVGNNLLTLTNGTNGTNVARIRFLTESSSINYTIDKVNIYLHQKLCDRTEEPNRTRTMIVMSDGSANMVCGMDPVQDWDGDSDTSDDPHDHAIQAACNAKNNYNITVHAVGFDISQGSIAETTLQQIASCGGGNYYLSNLTQLVQIYQEIANLILAKYSEQTLNSIAGNLDTKIYPNSVIELTYAPIQNPFGLIISLEEPFLNTTYGSFQTYSNSTILDAQVTSYSGARWTEKVKLNGNNIYNINNYGSSYTKLGDPYSVTLPKASILTQNNVVLTTGISASNVTVGSASNKIIYTLSKNFSSFSPILAVAQGCQWNLQFDDGSNLTAIIPPTYSGSSQCYFPPNGGFTHDPNDAFQVAAYSLLQQLDLDADGKINPKFTEQALQIDTSQISGIPFTWYSEVQIRTWS